MKNIKKILFLLFLISIVIIFNNINVLAKPINQVYNFDNEFNTSFTNIINVSDQELINIKGEAVSNPLDESLGKKPKVKAWLVGITGSEGDTGILTTEGGVFLFVIYWPDGKITVQTINPYTGSNSYLITDSLPNTSF